MKNVVVLNIIQTFVNQVFIQAPCCNAWFDCSECHDEKSDHQLVFNRGLRLTGKSCRRCFDRDLRIFAEKDKFCSSCGVEWCVPGEQSFDCLLASFDAMVGVTPERMSFDESLGVLDGYMTNALDAKNPVFNLPTAK